MIQVAAEIELEQAREQDGHPGDCADQGLSQVDVVEGRPKHRTHADGEDDHHQEQAACAAQRRRWLAPGDRSGSAEPREAREMPAHVSLHAGREDRTAANPLDLRRPPLAGGGGRLQIVLIQQYDNHQQPGINQRRFTCRLGQLRGIPSSDRAAKRLKRSQQVSATSVWPNSVQRVHSAVSDDHVAAHKKRDRRRENQHVCAESPNRSDGSGPGPAERRQC